MPLPPLQMGLTSPVRNPSSSIVCLPSQSHPIPSHSLDTFTRFTPHLNVSSKSGCLSSPDHHAISHCPNLNGFNGRWITHRDVVSRPPEGGHTGPTVDDTLPRSSQGFPSSPQPPTPPPLAPQLICLSDLIDKYGNDAMGNDLTLAPLQTNHSTICTTPLSGRCSPHLAASDHSRPSLPGIQTLPLGPTVCGGSLRASTLSQIHPRSAALTQSYNTPAENQIRTTNQAGEPQRRHVHVAAQAPTQTPAPYHRGQNEGNKHPQFHQLSQMSRCTLPRGCLSFNLYPVFFSG